MNLTERDLMALEYRCHIHGMIPEPDPDDGVFSSEPRHCPVLDAAGNPCGEPLLFTRRTGQSH